MTGTLLCSASKTILLLSLEKHREGIWIGKLLNILLELLLPTGITVEIVSIDTDDFWNGTSVDDLLMDYVGIINRVSDAADAPYVKRTIAIMAAARLLGIPVFNGPDAYSLCTSKWCHHILFRKAGLQYPSTTIIMKNCIGQVKSGQSYLIKPNSGGFGEGIMKIDGSLTPSTAPDIPGDDIKLLQDFIQPKDSKFYRVWFLNSKVQCAVERIDHGSFNGCSSGTCSRSITNAWMVPFDVCDEIERLISHVPDAHAGSVEFLIDSNGQRQYFDFNLLSTLPLDNLGNAHEIWGMEYDPWKDLALHVLNVLSLQSSR